ncbi:MAG: hypothetical protein ABIQ02_03890 [Saprospiraceae bacterium]
MNLVENPTEYLNNTSLGFEFSIGNTFGLNIYRFKANLNEHSLFNGAIQNGLVIIVFGPPIRDILPQIITITIELTKSFNVKDVYEQLAFEIKLFGLNTKVETNLDEMKQIVSESTTYLSSPQDLFISVELFYSIEGENSNHFVAKFSRAFDNEKLNSFLKEFQ